MNDIQVLRIGKISSINYKNGTAKVTYEDRGGDTTPELPFLAWEYWMPRVGDQVLVGHLSNGSASAFILGPVWNAAHRPYAYGSGYYRKDLSHKANTAAIIYDDSSGQLKIRASSIALEDYGSGGLLSVDDIRQAIQSLKNKVDNLSTRVSNLGG